MESITKKWNQNEVAINNESEKRIVEAFEIFDHTGNQTIDVREVGTVLCSLGCVPTNSEIQEIIYNVQDVESPDKVHLSKFLPLISALVSKYKFHPASAEELLAAFQVLDKDDTGFLTKDFLIKIMTEKGECFSQDELNEMLSVAVDPETGNIPYEYYINHIIID